MRRLPAPLSVTRPPPSSTTRREVLTTFAVVASVIVTGFRPQEKRMTPPLATAATTAAEVQPAGVPRPTTRSGCEVSTARASAGIEACPAGLPNTTRAGADVLMAARFEARRAAAFALAFAVAVVLRDAEGVGAAVVVRPEPPASGIVAVVAARGSAADEDGDDPCPQPVRAVTTAAER